VIDPATHRESDLLAFQIAIERAQPGAVMSAYNEINGVYASGNNELLKGVLKTAWQYRGWVTTDWGAVHSSALMRTYKAGHLGGEASGSCESAWGF